VKYALFVYDVPSSWDSYRLQPPQMTTTVRVEEGQTLTAEGPHADTREILAGFYVLESDDREAVLNVASMIPAARMGGAIEVRPLVER